MIELKQIGVIRSPIKLIGSMPPEGVDASIAINSDYLPALDGIETNTHYFILSWLDEADRSILKVSPRRKKDLPPKGVFSMRAPVRPNPIGLCVSKLKKIEDNILHFDHIDFIDGTPVIDIKPYLSGWDLIFSARNHGERDLYDRMDDEDLYKDLCRQTINFHGNLCVGGAIGVRAVMAFLQEQRNYESLSIEQSKTELPDATTQSNSSFLKLGIKDKDIFIEANARSCTLDAVQALTGAQHKRFFVKGPENCILFQTPHMSVTIELPTFKIKDLEELEGLTDQELFKITKTLSANEQADKK